MNINKIFQIGDEVEIYLGLVQSYDAKQLYVGVR